MRGDGTGWAGETARHPRWVPPTFWRASLAGRVPGPDSSRFRSSARLSGGASAWARRPPRAPPPGRTRGRSGPPGQSRPGLDCALCLLVGKLQLCVLVGGVQQPRGVPSAQPLRFGHSRREQRALWHGRRPLGELVEAVGGEAGRGGQQPASVGGGRGADDVVRASSTMRPGRRRGCPGPLEAGHDQKRDGPGQHAPPIRRAMGRISSMRRLASSYRPRRTSAQAQGPAGPHKRRPDEHGAVVAQRLGRRSSASSYRPTAIGSSASLQATAHSNVGVPSLRSARRPSSQRRSPRRSAELPEGDRQVHVGPADVLNVVRLLTAPARLQALDPCRVAPQDREAPRLTSSAARASSRSSSSAIRSPFSASAVPSSIWPCDEVDHRAPDVRPDQLGRGAVRLQQTMAPLRASSARSDSP